MKPCPFCGSTDNEAVCDEDNEYAMRCMNCGARGPCTQNSQAFAEDYWDDRYVERQ